MDILNRWKFIRDPKGIMAEAFILENLYMCQEIINMFALKEVLILRKMLTSCNKVQLEPSQWFAILTTQKS
jgi:hypothetical protein